MCSPLFDLVAEGARPPKWSLVLYALTNTEKVGTNRTFAMCHPVNFTFCAEYCRQDFPASNKHKYINGN